ncbi:MAG: aldo/keto reductase, partial [Alphaproteobacteria bacterium]|nr:aldo/keto reductase [Alphaproteobacteria bacterium]
VQNRYNLEDRQSDDVVDACARDGLAFLPWYPLAAGSLARARQLDAVAKRHGVNRTQVALAWLLRRSPAMLPIPGTSSIEHFEENLAAAEVALSDDEFRALADPRAG